MGLTAFSTIKNNVASLLNSSMDASQGNLQLVNGAGTLFPAAPFYVSVEFEVMRCTAKAGDTLTVSRGQDGTTAVAHAASSIVEMRGNAALWSEVQAAVNAIESGANQVPFNPPNGSITNAMLASDTSRQNFIQNGGFELWPYAGPIQGSVNNGTDVINGWIYNNAATGGTTLSIVRDSVNMESGQYCAALTCSNAAGVNTGIYQSPNAYALRGKTVTLSIRVKTSGVGGLVAYIFNNGGGGQQSNSSVLVVDNAYHTLTVTQTIHAAATTVNIGILIAGSSVGTLYVDSAALVIGSQAADYQPQLAYPDAVPNNRLGFDVPRPYNLLVNGGFEIASRGAGPFSTNASYSLDRWLINLNGTDTMQVSRASAGNGSIGSQYCATVVYTLGNGVSGALTQTLRSSEQYINSTIVSLSMRVYTDKANGVRIGINDTSGSTYYSDYHPGDSTWRTLRVTALISNSATAATVGAWFTVSGTYYLDNACLVVGTVAADYTPLQIADEQTRCERYFETAGGLTPEDIGLGMCYSATTGIVTWQYRTKKVLVPTITVVGLAGSGFAVQFGAGATSVISSLGASSVTTNISSFSVGSSALTPVGGVMRAYSNNAGSYISAEANP